MGHRAYGFSAAARTYFGKPLDALSVAQMAMLAGLPKAPSLYNPITSMKRAKQRQHYVLDRMYELDFIDEITYQAALKEDVKPIRSPENTLLPGQYIAEMVRQIMYDYYGRMLTQKDIVFTQQLIANIKNGHLMRCEMV